MAANSLAYQYKTAPVHIKLIVLNALFFIFVRLIGFFFNIDLFTITSWFVLPDSFSDFILQPWAFISYAFIHYDFFHILFNMLWLYWFGNFVLNLFDSKRFLTIYLVGAIAGGLLYVLSYNLFPVFEGRNAYLLGASGAVTAIMVFIATYTPNTAFRIFTFTIKLWQIATFLFVMDLVRLPASGNEGGLLAHIGGGIFGYLYAQQLAKGNDIGAWFTSFMDWISDLFTPRKKKPFKKVHRTQTTQQKTKRSTTSETKTDNQRKVDAILDKIGKSGYESLTKAEKDFLFKAGKE